MASSVLYYCYLGVMAVALFCFLKAYRVRFDTPRHKRWGMTGVLLSLGGIAVVLLGAALWGWTVDQRWPTVVLWHRRFAYLGTALILLTGVSGALRWKIHTRLFIVFLPVYALVLLLAILGYRP